ncbi:lysozyme inhibitor LprI family protein [Microbulbifer sp. YPW16]|nr:lysozyme inhibitor LprI family protein [Microbulbifer sp. YPW16]UHQ57056.1 DUF1311 domain-containing protein [Microbulbifer sp. YPW16]
MNAMTRIMLLIFACASSYAISEDSADSCTAENGGAMAAGLCIEGMLKKADEELNMAYKAAIERIREEDKYLKRNLEEEFRISQRAWLKYRDAHCSFEGESTGAAGGWSGIHISECILDMTKQ